VADIFSRLLVATLEATSTPTSTAAGEAHARPLVCARTPSPADFLTHCAALLSARILPALHIVCLSSLKCDL